MDEIARKLDELMGREEWRQAEELLTSGRDRAVRSGDRAAELSLCSELLGFYRMRSDPEGFFPVWKRTLALLDVLHAAGPGRGTILINGATGLVAFGRAEAALPFYREAYDCFLRSLPASDYRFAALFNNMAAAYEACGDFDRAKEHLRKAMGVLEKIPHHPDLATSYVNLAQLYARQDPADPRAGECLDRALELFDDPEMLWDGYYAHTVRKCAGAFADLGRGDAAAELEERAAVIYEGA